MSAIIGSLIGFFSSVIPDIFGMLRDRADRKHELAIMELQMKQQEMGHNQKLEEINVNADIAETTAIYKTYNTKIKWVDALNGTVRPVIAYGFFILYGLMKYATVSLISDGSIFDVITTIWTDEDQAIFAGVISFYFGQRAMNKIRGIN